MGCLTTSSRMAWLWAASGVLHSNGRSPERQNHGYGYGREEAAAKHTRSWHPIEQANSFRFGNSLANCIGPPVSEAAPPARSALIPTLVEWRSGALSATYFRHSSPYSF